MPAHRSQPRYPHRPSKSQPAKKHTPPPPPPRSSKTPESSRSPSPEAIRKNKNVETQAVEQDNDDGFDDDEADKDNTAHLKAASRALAIGEDAHADSEYLCKLKEKARWIKRLLGPDASVENILLFGPYCADAGIDLPELDAYSQEYLDSLDDNAVQKIATQYENLVFDILPTMHKDLAFFAEKNLRFKRLLSLLHKDASAGCRDDIKDLKYEIGLLLPLNGFYSNPINPSEQSKAGRGWACLGTAELLCPRSMLNTFKENPEKFCAEVVEGNKYLSAGDYMNYMYAEDVVYDEDDVEKGLLRNNFLLKVFRSIFTGRMSAYSKTPGPSTIGRRPIAVAAKRKTVTPAMIAWTVVMTYFALSSKEHWCLQDGGVDFAELYDEVIDAFGDQKSKWAVTTLQWWNLRVWGPSSVKPDARFQQRVSNSASGKLKAQRAARDNFDNLDD